MLQKYFHKLCNGLVRKNQYKQQVRRIYLSLVLRGAYDEEEEIIPIKKLTQNVGFIGDGNMARAICKGIATKDLIKYSQVWVSGPYIKNLDKWKVLGANVTIDNCEVVLKSDVIFLAVKPDILPSVVENIRKNPIAREIKDKLFVSILAGITLNRLESLFSTFEKSRVIRLMPNTPMLVGEGCTAYCPGKNTTIMDISIVRAILEVSGICQKIPENMINAVNAMSGGGPAFVYLMIEALSDGGVRMGLHRDMATKFAAQTFLGAAKMVLESDKHTGALKDAVCSAGGTTIAGIHELEKGAVRGSIMNAVEASAKKADELGQKE